jgi:phage shock protein E|tara:strand:- start:46 stop:324 length:279 start_codon:yes stop_codon:yes gene_type:complete
MDLFKLINNKKTTIVDVRTPQEFSENRVESSINIPLNVIPEKIKELKEMQPIVMCCAAGIRSGQAVEFLKSNGFVEVFNGGSWNDVLNMLES